MRPDMNKKAIYFVIFLLLLGEVAGDPPAGVWFAGESYGSLNVE